MRILPQQHPGFGQHSLVDRVDLVCEAFEKEWRSCGGAVLEEFLADIPTEEVSRYLEELLAVELAMRESRGESPRASEYEARFPSFADVIRAVFRKECPPDGQRPADCRSDPPPIVGCPTPASSAAFAAANESTVIAPAESASAESVTGQSGWPKIPGYEILEELGRGGMGIVYKARHKGLKRVVALKMLVTTVLNEVMVLERFRGEAETLARMQHPGIVHIHEVGDWHGTQFLSLEFVDGENLDKKLSGRPLEPEQAARYVETIANAIEFAHQQGVIHRDLKPANVLLSRSGQLKVTDFGLAKRLDADEAHTVSGTVMGTPSFMAPEQARGQLSKVGTVSDVYSMGAMLYAFLTGRAPFQSPSVWETVRQVIDDDPLPPRRLVPKTPRDLETICLTCLQKAPERRYGSARALAGDLRRYLNHEPILARPASLLRRALLWGRRKPLVAGLLLLSLVLFVFLGVATTHLYFSNQREREATIKARSEELAANREREHALSARDEAERKRREATEVVHFLQELFLTSDPLGLEGTGFRGSREKGTDMTARDLLETGLIKVDSQLIDQPLVRAALLDTLGSVYRGLGYVDEAERPVLASLKIREAILKQDHPDHEDLGASYYSTARIRHDQGRYSEAEEWYRKALTIRKLRFGVSDLRVASTKFGLAWVIVHRFDDVRPEQFQEAERLLLDVVAVRRKILGEKHREVGLALAGLAALYLGRDDTRLKGISTLQEAYSILGGTDAVGTCITMYLASQAARQAGLYQQAVVLHQKALSKSCELLGDEHPLNIMLLGDLAGLLRQNGDLSGGEKAIRKVIDVSRRSPLRWHPELAKAMLELSKLEFERGDVASARELHRHAREIADRIGKKDLLEQCQAHLEMLNNASPSPPQ